MVYGYSEAGSANVRSLAAEKRIPSYDHLSPIQGDKTLSGRSFIPLKIEHYGEVALCKNTLVAVVVENCLRKSEGFPILPVIFCLSSTKCPLLPIQWIADQELNDFEVGWISNKELRRIYKLCNDPELSSEVKQVAKETFKCVHVHLPHLELEEIPPPWEEQTAFWDQVRAEKKAKQVEQRRSSRRLDWRPLLVDPTKARELLMGGP